MRAAVLYDADCGFCERSVRIVRWLRLPIDVVAIADADLAALGIDPIAAMTAMPFVDETGRVRAKGLVNSREQLDSLFAARDLGVGSVQEYLDQPRFAKETT